MALAERESEQETGQGGINMVGTEEVLTKDGTGSISHGNSEKIKPDKSVEKMTTKKEEDDNDDDIEDKTHEDDAPVEDDDPEKVKRYTTAVYKGLVQAWR